MVIKEIYKAPEVELLLFCPVESLAVSDGEAFWNAYGRSGGTGQVGGDTNYESKEDNTVTDEESGEDGDLP